MLGKNFRVLVPILILCILGIGWSIRPASGVLPHQHTVLEIESTASGALPLAGQVLSDDPLLVNLRVPSKGWLVVEVTAPLAGEVRPWLQVIRDVEAARQPPASSTAAFGPALLEVEPGPLALHLGSVLPLAATEPLWLRAHFVPAADPRTEIQLAATGEIHSLDTGPRADGLSKDGDAGDDTEAGDGELLPNKSASEGAFWWGCLLGHEPLNDFVLCPMDLDDRWSVESQLEAGRSLDRDHFAIRLEEAATLQVSVNLHRSAVAHLEVLTLAGEILVQSEVGGPSDNPPLEMSLPAGDYFLRLAGRGGVGYTMQVRSAAD